MRKASVTALNYSCSPPEAGTKKLFVTDDGLRDEWRRAVIRLPRAQAAEVARVTAQAVSLWHKGQRAPSAATLINLARAFPSIRAWLYEQIESGDRAAQSFSPDAMNEALVRMAGNGELAAILRRTLTLQDKQERRAVETERAKGGKI